MKKFVVAVALAVVSMTADAGDLAWVTNEGGGKITLTDVSGCQYNGEMGGNGHYATGTNSGGKVNLGCWSYDERDDSVYVIWLSGDLYKYSGKHFTITEYGDKVFGENK